jgi:hypothetical protein
MIDLPAIERCPIETVPFRWASIDRLFCRRDAHRLAKHYPHDHFKTVDGYDGEKSYRYEVRALIHMGAAAPAFAESLDPAWQQLAADLLSPAYRSAMAHCTGCDLANALLEVNVFHFGAGAWMGPHVDHKDKIVTHVLYFNADWNREEGGCLSILRSKNPADLYATIEPTVGNSAVIVRSNHSWHSVANISQNCRGSRRSVTVTFYHPGSKSTMWPPGSAAELHDYIESGGDVSRQSVFGRILSRLRSKRYLVNS